MAPTMRLGLMIAVTAIALGIIGAGLWLVVQQQTVERPTPPATLPAAPLKPKPIILGFGGDVMLDRGVRASVNKHFSGDYRRLFDNLELISRADLFFINLEGPVSDIGVDRHNLYSFRMDPIVLPILHDAGIDIVSFANNHVGDWGRAAFDDTRARLTAAGIGYTGAGDNDTAVHEPVVRTIRGVRIGYLGASDVGPNDLAATKTASGILLASDPHLGEYIAAAAHQVDVLVMSFHWGDEYVPANERQRGLARLAINNGARLVIGHHPHVEQATEIYNEGLIAYSLGNFIFDQPFSTATMQGLMLMVTIDPTTHQISTTTQYTVPLNKQYQPQTPVQR